MQKTKEEFKGGSKVIKKCKLICLRAKIPTTLQQHLTDFSKEASHSDTHGCSPWGPGCCCWKPWQSPCATSLLLLPKSPFSPFPAPCCAFLYLLRGALCIFSSLILGVNRTSRPTTILWFSSLLSRHSTHSGCSHFKLYQEEQQEL